MELIGILASLFTSKYRANPGLINSDPYGEGWVARVEPADWAADSAGLLTGPEAITAYQAFLEREGITCGD